jgi:predicted DNA-binding transcriptional regulator AlpA
MKKAGRPSIIINDDMCRKAESLSAKGLTMQQIADCLGLGLSTIYEKYEQYPEFAEAIKRGKAKGVATMTNALFNKGMGGDTGCMIFFLKNRAGWKDKNETENTGAIEHIFRWQGE